VLALLGKDFLLSLSLCLDIGIVYTALINASLAYLAADVPIGGWRSLIAAATLP
jgi:hypothetical protein